MATAGDAELGQQRRGDERGHRRPERVEKDAGCWGLGDVGVRRGARMLEPVPKRGIRSSWLAGRAEDGYAEPWVCRRGSVEQSSQAPEQGCRRRPPARRREMEGSQRQGNLGRLTGERRRGVAIGPPRRRCVGLGLLMSSSANQPAIEQQRAPRGHKQPPGLRMERARAGAVTQSGENLLRPAQGQGQGQAVVEEGATGAERGGAAGGGASRGRRRAGRCSSTSCGVGHNAMVGTSSSAPPWAARRRRRELREGRDERIKQLLTHGSHISCAIVRPLDG